MGGMRVLFNRIRQALSSRLWAWPLVAALAGAVAAVFLGAVQVSSELWLSRFLWPGDTAAASSMLGFIASTTLTVLTTTISMTLIVLQVASGNFSHQLLRDFISSRAVRGILAVYIGVFTYTLLLARSLDSDDKTPPQVAMTVAMVAIFTAVGTFIWYVSRVVDMVRVDSIIDSSARRTMRLAKPIADSENEKPQADPVPRPEVPADAHKLVSNRFGYVQGADIEHAEDWANKNGATVVIDVRPGDSVISGQPMAWYWGMSADDEGEVPELPEVVYLDLERASGQDYSLGLRQILDIAVRALSPGINDPTTALHVVGQAATVLRALARNPADPEVRYAHSEQDDEPGRLVVWAAVRGTPELLEGFVGGLRRYCGSDPELLLALLRLLDVVEEDCRDDVRAVVRDERQRIVALAERMISEPYDLSLVLEAAHVGVDREDLEQL